MLVNFSQEVFLLRNFTESFFFARELYTEDQTLLSLKSMKVLSATSAGTELDQRQYLCIFCPRFTMSPFLFLCMSVGIQLCSCNYL